MGFKLRRFIKDLITAAAVAAAVVLTGGTAGAALLMGGLTLGLSTYGNVQADRLAAEQRRLMERLGAERPDQGVRQQLGPATDNFVPVIYGSVYTKGIITDARISSNNQTMTYVMVLSEQTTSGEWTFGDVYWNDERLTFPQFNPAQPTRNLALVTGSVRPNGTVNTRLANRVSIQFYRGSSELPWTPNIGFQPQAAYQIVPGWDQSWMMRGLIFAVVKITYNADAGITGLPNLTFQVNNSLTNPGLVLADYLVNQRYGAGISDQVIDMASITWTEQQTTAAGLPVSLRVYSDQVLTAEDSEGQIVTAPRARINGIIPTQRGVQENIDQLMLASGSWFTFDYSQGLWRVIVNRAQTSGEAATNLLFDDSNIIGAIQVTTTDLDRIYNSVEAEYVESRYRDQSEFARVTVTSPERGPGEPDNALRLRFEMVTNYVQATRLSRLALNNNRSDVFVEFSTDFSGLQISPGSIIRLTSDSHGWSDQRFRVMSVDEQDGDGGMITTRVRAQIYRVTDYDEPVVVDIPIPIRDNIPDFVQPPAPSQPVILDYAFNRPRSFIRLQSSIPANAGIMDRIQWQMSPDNGNSWWNITSEQVQAQGGENITGYVSPVRTDVNYQARVRVSRAGIFSDWSPVLDVTVALPPNNPSGLVATGIPGGIRLDWDAGSDLIGAPWTPSSTSPAPTAWWDADAWSTLTIHDPDLTQAFNADRPTVTEWRSRTGTYRAIMRAGYDDPASETQYSGLVTGQNWLTNSERSYALPGGWRGFDYLWANRASAPAIAHPFGGVAKADLWEFGLSGHKQFQLGDVDPAQIFFAPFPRVSNQISANQETTFSIYVRGDRADWIGLGLEYDISGQTAVVAEAIELVSGGGVRTTYPHPTLTPQPVSTGRGCVAVGDGWFRIWITHAWSQVPDRIRPMVYSAQSRGGQVYPDWDNQAAGFPNPSGGLGPGNFGPGYYVWGWQYQSLPVPGTPPVYGRTYAWPMTKSAMNSRPYLDNYTSAQDFYYRLDPEIVITRNMTVMAVFSREVMGTPGAEEVCILANESNITQCAFRAFDNAAQFGGGLRIGYQANEAPQFFGLNNTLAAGDYVMVSRQDSTNTDLWLNGSRQFIQQNTQVDPTGQTFNTLLGSNLILAGGPQTRHRGHVSEIIVWNHGLSTDERQRAEGYLAHKWGLVNQLPGDHPYRNNQPTAVVAGNNLNYAYTEIWESVTNDRSQAVRIGTTAGTTYTRVNIPPGETRYYWIRHRDFEDQASQYFPVSATGGVPGAALPTDSAVDTTLTIQSGGLTLDLTRYRTFRWTQDQSISALNLVGVPPTVTIRTEITSGGAAYTINWPASFRWPNNTPPVLSSTPGQTDVFEFSTTSSGTVWYARIIGQGY